MQYGSEFGHLIRIVTIFAKMEHVLDELNGQFSFLFTFSFSERFLITIDPKISSNPIASLNEAEQKMDVCSLSISLLTRLGVFLDTDSLIQEWDRTLPDHLRFSEQSLQVQQSMFETSSNTGAWCWCMLHVYHASCALALNFVIIFSPTSDGLPVSQNNHFPLRYDSGPTGKLLVLSHNGQLKGSI